MFRSQMRPKPLCQSLVAQVSDVTYAQVTTRLPSLTACRGRRLRCLDRHLADHDPTGSGRLRIGRHRAEEGDHPAVGEVNRLSRAESQQTKSLFEPSPRESDASSEPSDVVPRIDAQDSDDGQSFRGDLRDDFVTRPVERRLRPLRGKQCLQRENRLGPADFTPIVSDGRRGFGVRLTVGIATSPPSRVTKATLVARRARRGRSPLARLDSVRPRTKGPRRRPSPRAVRRPADSSNARPCPSPIAGVSLAEIACVRHGAGRNARYPPGCQRISTRAECPLQSTVTAPADFRRSSVQETTLPIGRVVRMVTRLPVCQGIFECQTADAGSFPPGAQPTGDPLQSIGMDEGQPQPSIVIQPLERPIRATVRPPGSKSITNRALVVAGLAEGTSRLTARSTATIPG